MKQSIREGLKPYLPDNSLETILQWIDGRRIQVRITNGRRSKLGDYRPPVKDQFHRISVNGDLNPYEFLITLTHEIAHLSTWEKFGKRARPHGKAWKAQYASMLSALLGKNIFPAEIETVVMELVTDPKANSKSSVDLVRALRSHNREQKGHFLEELPDGALFILPDGRKFRKVEKLRKWYRCISLDSQRPYRISPVAVVFPLEN